MTAVACDPEDLPATGPEPEAVESGDNELDEPFESEPRDDEPVDEGAAAAPDEDDDDDDDPPADADNVVDDTTEDEPPRVVQVEVDENGLIPIDVTALVAGTWTVLTEPPPEVDASGVSITIGERTDFVVIVDAADESDHYALSLSVDTAEGGFLTFRCASLPDADGGTFDTEETTYFIDGIPADPPGSPTCADDGLFSMSLPLQCNGDLFVAVLEAGEYALIVDVPPQITVDSGDATEPAIAVYDLDIDPTTICVD